MTTRLVRLLAGLAVLLSASLPVAPAHASCGAESCALDNTALGGRPPRLSMSFSYQQVDQDEIRTGAGAQLPTGERHVEPVDGEEPEPHARLGTGSLDLLIGAQIVHLSPLPAPAAGGSPTALFASALYFHTGHGTNGYRVGPHVEANAGASYPLAGRLRLLAQTNLLARDEDHVEAQTQGDTTHQHVAFSAAAAAQEHGHQENTGRLEIFVTPGLRYDIGSLVALSGYFQFPVYRRLNGTQITAPGQFWIGATYKLP